LSQRKLDDIYFAVVSQSKNNSMSLQRFQFIDILVRVSIMKYPFPETAAKAFEILLERNLVPNFPEAEDWQGFRENHLYNIECDEIF
jgi:hypothetical protein